jgi:short-subunit dehydrogenase
VDRRENELARVCEAIAARHGVRAEAYTVDLSQRQEVEALAKRLEPMDDVALLVNNAGFGTIDYFVDTEPRHLADMALVHVVAPTILTRAVLPGMLERKGGAIINVSSVAAWFQSACNVQYGSTKSYLTVFTMALAQELRGTDVRVQALCPGFVRTEFHDAECMKGFSLRCAPAAQYWMSPDEVVRCSLRRLSSGQVIVVPGLTYRLLGRLAQMPLLQPLFQWATWAPRLAPSPAPAVGPAPDTAPTVDPCPAPAFAVAEVPESAASQVCPLSVASCQLVEH